jgi:hypothetical protein
MSNSTPIYTYTEALFEPAMPGETRILQGQFLPNLTVAAGQTVAQVSASGKWGLYADANTDGTQVAKGFARRAFKTDADGNVILGDAAEYGVTHLTAEIHTKGVFATKGMTGLDAAAVTDLGRLVSGTVADGLLVLA